MTGSTARTAADAFHTMGGALVTLGRQLTIGTKIIALGRQLCRVKPSELEDDKQSTLRRPIDELRALAHELAEFACGLRTILDELSALVGVDN